MSNQMVQHLINKSLQQSQPLLIFFSIVLVISIGFIIFGWFKDGEEFVSVGVLLSWMAVTLIGGTVYMSYALPKDMQTAVNTTNAKIVHVQKHHGIN